MILQGGAAIGRRQHGLDAAVGDWIAKLFGLHILPSIDRRHTLTRRWSLERVLPAGQYL